MFSFILSSVDVALKISSIFFMLSRYLLVSDHVRVRYIKNQQILDKIEGKKPNMAMCIFFLLHLQSKNTYK